MARPEPRWPEPGFPAERVTPAGGPPGTRASDRHCPVRATPSGSSAPFKKEQHVSVNIEVIGGLRDELGLNKIWVNYVSAPRTRFICPNGAGDLDRMLRYAGSRLPHVHIADCFNHKANAGIRYIINPPGVDARIHQHNEIGNGDVDWDQFFGTAARHRIRRHRNRLRVRLGGNRRRHPATDAQPRAERARRMTTTDQLHRPTTSDVVANLRSAVSRSTSPGPAR